MTNVKIGLDCGFSGKAQIGKGSLVRKEQEHIEVKKAAEAEKIRFIRVKLVDVRNNRKKMY